MSGQSAFSSFLSCLLLLTGSIIWSAPPQALDKQRTDLFGDPLPPEALVRLGTVRLRTGGYRGPLVFSADGKELISASSNGLVHYWETATGKPLRRFRTISWAAADIKLSPDRKLVAASALFAPTSIGLWDTATEKLVRRLEVPAGGKALRVAFSPDGKTLVSGGGPDKKVCFWDVATGRLLRQLPLNTSIAILDFSPDGKTLVTKTPGWVHLWDPTTGKERRQFHVSTNNTPDYAFSPDGKTLAASRIDGLDLFEVATGAKRGQMPAEPRNAVAVAFSPDGKTLAAASFSTIRFLNVATRKEIAHTAEPGLWVGSLQFSPDGKTVASRGSTSGAIRLWDAATGKELQHRSAHSSGVMSVIFSPDGTHLSTHASDAAVRIWRAATGELQQILPVESTNLANSITSLCFARNGKSVIFADNRGVIHVRALENGKEIRQLPLGADARRFEGFHVRGLAVSADGETLTALAQHTMRENGLARPKRSALTAAWDLATGKQIRKRDDATIANGDWTLAPDGKYWAAFNQGARVSVYAVAAGEHVLTIDGQCDSVWPVAFSPDSRLLAGVCHHGKAKEGIDDYLSSIVLWELAIGAEVRRFRLKPGSPEIAVAFSTDGRILASGGDDAVGLQLWDLTTGAELHRFAAPGATVRSLSFDAVNQRLAGGLADGTTLLWDAVAFVRRAGPHPKQLTASDLAHLWDDLKSKEAGKAHTALWVLAGAREQAVAFLRDRLPPVKVDAERIRRLIADLDRDQFAVRDAATKALEQLGTEAEPLLRKARADKPAAELRKRIDALLAGPRIVRSPEVARQVRAIRVLEWIGSPQARRHLEALASGAPEARLTQEAKDSLQRLTPRK